MIWFVIGIVATIFVVETSDRAVDAYNRKIVSDYTTPYEIRYKKVHRNTRIWFCVMMVTITIIWGIVVIMTS